MADLNGALNQLDDTIKGISGKVEEQKARVTQYKTNLLEKLKQLKISLDGIKNNTKWQEIADLRQQLQQLPQLQQQLQEKIRNLDQAKETINDLQFQIQRFNQEIQAKNEQIQKLLQDGENKDNQIKDIEQQIQNLTTDKKALEDNLQAKTDEVNVLANRIQLITGSLGNQIQNINQIADQLGDLDNGEIGEQFNLITGNITAIIDILEGRRLEGTESPVQQVEQEFSAEIEQLYNDLIGVSNSENQEPLKRLYTSLRSTPNALYINKIQSAINNAKRNDPIAIKQIKQALKELKEKGVNINFNIPGSRGGKRRRKTMKKRHRRTRKKMRGGYNYSPSKELDKSSSVISGSSSFKSSRPKSQKQIKHGVNLINNYTRHKYM